MQDSILRCSQHHWKGEVLYAPNERGVSKVAVQKLLRRSVNALQDCCQAHASHLLTRTSSLSTQMRWIGSRLPRKQSSIYHSQMLPWSGQGVSVPPTLGPFSRVECGDDGACRERASTSAISGDMTDPESFELSALKVLGYFHLESVWSLQNVDDRKKVRSWACRRAVG